MWDGLWMVLSLGGIMALASFLAGSFPLFFSLSQRQMRLISTIGTGILVGTALIVIIPEGIETMYSATAAAEASAHSSPMTEGKDEHALAALATKHGVGPQQQQNEAAGRAEELAHLSGRAVHWAVGALLKRAEDEHGHTHSHSHDSMAQGHEHAVSGHEHEHAHDSSHAWIGIALVLGFVLMYLIDALQKPASARGTHIPLSQMDPEDGVPTAGKTHIAASSASPSKSTTLGLVIHSFADGIALGASSAGDAKTQSTLGLVVFVAILVHKAPAAFGLTSVLLKQGLSKRAIRGHLLVFSLAAPVGALVTWMLVNLLGGAVASNESSSMWYTGVVLVFSGGTFLFVAMHAMQEAGHDHGTDNAAPAGKSGTDIILMVTGMLLPLLTQIGHAHAHGH